MKIKGKPEVRRELVPRKARKAPALPLLYWSVGVSWLMVLVEKMVPSGLTLGSFPGVCAEEKLRPFSGQLGLPFLTGVAEVPEICTVSACEGCWLKFLYFITVILMAERKKENVKRPVNKSSWPEMFYNPSL